MLMDEIIREVRCTDGRAKKKSERKNFYLKFYLISVVRARECPGQLKVK